TSVELKRGLGLFLDDAINTNTPGVFMQRRTVSAGQQFNIRGYGNGARGTNGISSNFDGQGTKVYLNGIPLTDAEGITLMDDIDFNSIGNVEILKGPSGTLYGLAIAGVVNLKTVVAEKNKVSVGQEVMVGSYGLQRYTTSLRIGSEKSSFLVNYGKQHFDGFMNHTASDKNFVNVIGEMRLSEKQSMSTFLSYSNSYDERNGELTKGQYDTLDYVKNPNKTGNPAYIKNDAHSNVISIRTGVSHTYRLNRNISNTTVLFGSGLNSNVSSAGGWTDKAPVNYGLRSSFDLSYTLSSTIRLNGIIGMEAQRQNAQTIGYAMVPDSFNLSGDNIIGAMRSNQYTVNKTSSYFAEFTLSLPKEFSLTAGIGSSNMNIALYDRFYVASNNNPSNPKGTRNPRTYEQSYSGLYSPHLALNKVFRKNYSAYFSYSTGYKAPVSSYFFIPVTGQVNTGLIPERGSQVEIGTKGNTLKGRLHYEMAYFMADFTNKMTVFAVPIATGNATAYTYVANGGAVKNKGIELMLKGSVYESATGFISAIKPFFNLAYSRFRYGNFKVQQLSADRRSIVESDFSHNVLPGVPKITFNAGVDFLSNKGIYGNINYNFRDSMYYTSDNKNVAKGFSLLNARVGFRKSVLKRFDLDIYAGANNITSKQYYQMVFVNQLPDAYLPGPAKINYFSGINLRYSFK
ncbi:MAG: TonB-dependent receptor plug domain-containing protein, partial [Bacteroidetes bacterium]|nr:TonB-dependent receptor plug domain-containing protein [Bacteroidota bacterium]